MEQILAGRDPSQTPPIRSSGKKPITDRNREQEPQMGTDKIPGRPTDKTDKCSNDSDHRTDKSHRCGFHDLQQIRLLSEVAQFVGVDGCSYGPFQAGDISAMPSIHAKNLVQRGAACPINPDPGLGAGVVG